MAIGETVLGAVLQVVLDRLASPAVINFFLSSKLDQSLVDKLTTLMLAVEKLMLDAEDKQFTDPVVKKWLDKLKHWFYRAEEIVDEIATEALRISIESPPPESLSFKTKDYLNPLQWLELLLNSPPDDRMSRLAYGMECIWGARNELCFNGHRFDVTRISGKVECFALSFQETVSSDLARTAKQQKERRKWDRPPMGMVKINFDASTCTNERGMGLGMIIRDEEGTFIAAEAKFISAKWPIQMGEAEAALMGLMTAQQLGHSILLEGDAQRIPQQIKMRCTQRGPEGMAIEAILRKLDEAKSVTVNWVERLCNGATDRIARWARINESDQRWVTEAPSWLYDILVEDRL